VAVKKDVIVGASMVSRLAFQSYVNFFSSRIHF
jgi:hypothetical protein